MNKRILDTCLSIARSQNTEKKHPEYGSFMHFSFVVKDNKVLEYATNRGGAILYKKFYTRLSKTHAEAAAYSKAKGLMRKGDSFEMVNIRLNKAGELRNSAPCESCFTILSLFGCTKVWFTTKEGVFEKVTL
jgi:hypothetical protein